MVNVPFSQSAGVQLDASGNGIASLGPLSAREKWQPTNVSVSVASNAKEAQCQIYVGDIVAQQYSLGLTFTGSSGDAFTGLSATVKCGQKLWAVWSGGDANANAVVQVTGTKDV
jgi:hypothetical protein